MQVPILLHGDEGQTLKKAPIFIWTWGSPLVHGASLDTRFIITVLHSVLRRTNVVHYNHEVLPTKLLLKRGKVNTTLTQLHTEFARLWVQTLCTRAHECACICA